MTIMTSCTIHRIINCFLISVVSLFVYITYNSLSFSLTGKYLIEPSNRAYLFFLISYIITIYVVSLLFVHFPLSHHARSVSLFCYFLFLTGGLQTTVHRVMLTETRISDLILVSVLLSFVITFMIIKLFHFPAAKNKNYFDLMKAYFKRRHLVHWGIRILSGLFLLFLTYVLISRLLYPFVEPYYNSQSYDFLDLTGHIDAVKRNTMMIQSVIMSVVFLPLFALWNGSKSSLLFWFGFPLFVVVALQPFFLYCQWPLGFRFPMLIQTTLVIYIQSIILVQLFYVPPEISDEEESYSRLWTYNDY